MKRGRTVRRTKRRVLRDSDSESDSEEPSSPVKKRRASAAAPRFQFKDYSKSASPRRKVAWSAGRLKRAAGAATGVDAFDRRMQLEAEEKRLIRAYLEQTIRGMPERQRNSRHASKKLQRLKRQLVQRTLAAKRSGHVGQAAFDAAAANIGEWGVRTMRNLTAAKTTATGRLFGTAAEIRQRGSKAARRQRRQDTVTALGTAEAKKRHGDAYTADQVQKYGRQLVRRIANEHSMFESTDSVAEQEESRSNEGAMAEMKIAAAARAAVGLPNNASEEMLRAAEERAEDRLVKEAEADSDDGFIVDDSDDDEEADAPRDERGRRKTATTLALEMQQHLQQQDDASKDEDEVRRVVNKMLDAVAGDEPTRRGVVAVARQEDEATPSESLERVRDIFTRTVADGDVDEQDDDGEKRWQALRTMAEGDSPGRKLIFGSMRFDGKIPPMARALATALQEYGLTLTIVDVKAGEDIDKAVFRGIEEADSFLVFGSANYGKDTGNQASTFYEHKHAFAQKKKIILIRMIPWTEQFEEQQARVIFGQNRLQLEWQVGQPMPTDLASKIAEAVGSDLSALDILRWIVERQLNGGSSPRDHENLRSAVLAVSKSLDMTRVEMADEMAQTEHHDDDVAHVFDDARYGDAIQRTKTLLSELSETLSLIDRAAKAKPAPWRLLQEQYQSSLTDTGARGGQLLRLIETECAELQSDLREHLRRLNRAVEKNKGLREMASDIMGLGDGTP